jgi:hypothetical protein
LPDFNYYAVKNFEWDKFIKKNTIKSSNYIARGKYWAIDESKRSEII